MHNEVNFQKNASYHIHRWFSLRKEASQLRSRSAQPFREAVYFGAWVWTRMLGIQNMQGSPTIPKWIPKWPKMRFEGGKRIMWLKDFQTHWLLRASKTVGQFLEIRNPLCCAQVGHPKMAWKIQRWGFMSYFPIGSHLEASENKGHGIGRKRCAIPKI